MAWTTISKPAHGDPTRLALINAVIDDLNFLRTLVEEGGSIPNPSFENDGDGDGVPDSWTVQPYAGGGTFSITGSGLADTANQHGAFAVKFVKSAGGGNGGGEIMTSSFLPIGPTRRLGVSWQMKSSAATLANRVEVRWYDDGQSFISAVDIYNNAATNPTAWTLHRGLAKAPATARFFKLKLIGGDTTNATGGTTYFDDVRADFVLHYSTEVYLAPGTTSWYVPVGVNSVLVEALGGGAGGGVGQNPDAAGGGGGGSWGLKMFDVIPGTLYAVEVGAGGTSGANGTRSKFDTLIAGGGLTGSGSGPGGAGGSSSGGDENESGTAGSAGGGAGGGGGDGGPCPVAATGVGTGGTASVNGTAALEQGCGGGGGSDFAAGKLGGTGGAGFLRIRW